MEPDYSFTDDDGSSNTKTLIPGVTNNKKGMMKFYGCVLLSAVLNQTVFIFERN
jgi:hypothetical protein